jgi:hypothetical protein
MEAFRDPTPVKQRTQIRSVADEVWWIICGMGFCVVDNVLRRDNVLPENFHRHGRFPSRIIRFRYKTTKWISNRMNIATPTITAFPIVVCK